MFYTLLLLIYMDVYLVIYGRLSCLRQKILTQQYQVNILTSNDEVRIKI
jgi:hypothetical protein